MTWADKPTGLASDLTSRALERALLEEELAGARGLELLRLLQARVERARAFESWAQVADYLHNQKNDAAGKEAILRGVIALRSLGLRVWSSAIILLFWPGLMALFGKRLRWDQDPEDLWQEVMAVFLNNARRFDLRMRKERVASKLMNVTYGLVFRRYETIWKWGHEESRDPRGFERMTCPTAELAAAEVELRDEQELLIRGYRAALEARVITEEVFHLLVGTCVYEQSVADYARERGLRYQATKKRRQRALARIDRWRRGK